MQVGNARYLTDKDLPGTIAVFPLSGVLLLPGGQLPLNIYEPRYIAMIDDVLRGHRLIGIIQPEFSETRESPPGSVALCQVGCIGRLTSFAETGDGRYMLTLTGVCRFRLLDELSTITPYRQFRIAPFLGDVAASEDDSNVDRDALLSAFKAYLDANQLEADWESVGRASNMTLVNALSMMAPFGPPEKQALLEAPDLKTRAETLVAITEIALARDFSDTGTTLQ